MTRWMMLAAMGLVSCTWAQADTAHYVINLQGWDPSQEFTFNPNVPPPDESSPCLPVGSFCNDPSIRINSGGGSTPESGTFTFNSNQADGNGNLFFENTGPTITSIEIVTFLTPDEIGADFECSGGDLFQNCGFVDPPEELDIYFWNPYTNGIPSAVPEPSQGIILLIGIAGMVILLRARKKSATSAYVQTPQATYQALDS